MPKLFDRVKGNTPTTGTGTITFGSAASNAFLTPAEAGCADSDTVRYFIVDGTDFEEGIGTIGDSVTTMARTTVTKSKIGGTAGTTKLDLSGTAVFGFTASADDIVNKANVTTVGNALLTAADAAAAQTAAGASAVGKALFTAEDEDAAQDAAGASAVGKAIFTAADVDTALNELAGTTLGKAVFTATSVGAARDAIGAGAPDVIIEDQKTSGTHGGTATSGSWQTRVLNTLVRNNGSVASLSSSQFTLSAGSYYVSWSAPSNQTNSNQTRLQNITDATTAGYGSSEYSGSSLSDSTACRSFGSTVVTIAGSKAFEIQHRVGTTHANTGYGVAGGLGTEVYTRVEITKLN